MKRRGRLQEGAFADVTLFDPETVVDHATFEAGKNSLPSSGIPYVVVNGQIVLDDSHIVDNIFPGVAIRGDIRD